MASQSRFGQGLALHRQGDLAAAERIYGEVLDREPQHFDALHMLGVVALQTRRTAGPKDPLYVRVKWATMASTSAGIVYSFGMIDVAIPYCSAASAVVTPSGASRAKR